MTSSAQLERETEIARARLADSLEELRARVTPGQVVDQLVDYARDSGAGEFARNLGRDVVRNPLPLGLLGVGLAWLMVSNGRSRRVRANGGSNDVAGPMGPSTGAGVASASHSAADRVSEAASRLSAAAGSAAASVSEGATTAYEGAAGAYRSTADAAASLGRNVAARGGDLLGLCRDQPLVLAGLGLMIGAALGAAVPATRKEQELMGEASEEFKERAESAAQEQYENVKEVARDAYEDAKSGVAQSLRDALDEAQEEADRAGRTSAAPGEQAPLVPASEPETALPAGSDDAAGEKPLRPKDERTYGRQ